jgi:hypothetical protein
MKRPYMFASFLETIGPLIRQTSTLYVYVYEDNMPVNQCGKYARIVRTTASELRSSAAFYTVVRHEAIMRPK